MALVPQYKTKTEFHDGDNSDIMSVLEKNFIGARKSVERDDWYKQFEGRDLNETCKNVWEYVKTNIPYHEDGIEQRIVMPPRLIANAREHGIGADCKSMALICCAILSHFCKKNVGFRYTSYRNNPTPTHVYCIVDDGQYIVDAVYKQYNHEKPYKFKYDKIMKISTISGIDSGKLNISQDAYSRVVAYDKIRKSFKEGSDKRKLFDLLWATELKKAVDANQDDSINGWSDIVASVNKVYQQATKAVTDTINKGKEAIKISKPSWASTKDEELHYLLKLNPAMIASREAFRVLATLNAFGIINRLFDEESKKPLSISRWWYRSGGDPDTLWKFLTKDRNKKPLFGVQEKVQKAIDKIKEKAGINGIYDASIDEFGIGVAGVDDVAVAGGGVTAVIGTIIASAPVLISLIQTIGNIFDKNIPLPDDKNQPPIIQDEPKAFDKNLLIYGAIGVGALIVLPKILKNK
jgi:hypothetical protein